jgi:dipeptidase
MPLFVKAAKPVSLNTTMWQMRGHYDGSWFDTTDKLDAGPYHSPYRARPGDFVSNGAKYAFNRNIGYVGTFFHFVAQARSMVPPPAGGVIWFGVDDAALSVLTPMYAVTNAAPTTWAYGNGATGTYSQRSAYWAFNVVANYAYTRWDMIGAQVQAKVVATEQHAMAAVLAADGHAAHIAARDGVPAAVAYLSNFSISTADALVDEWVAYFPQLFVKYRDGLLVQLPAPAPAHPKDLPPPPGCSEPGYDESWYARIVADTGDQYLLPTDRTGGTVPDHAVVAADARKLALLSSRRVLTPSG